jgi:uncharacterized repeat protein (TIGR03843 family)
MSREACDSSRPESEHVLAHGALQVQGQLSGASNATLLCSIVDSVTDATMSCVYKPRRGERPLWDFPSGTLGRREVSAYLLSELAGWHLVPTTVWREEGPFGPGMCQAWVDDDMAHPAVTVVSPGDVPDTWRVVLEAQTYDGTDVVLIHEDSMELKRMAVFDFLANNADRKGGHILRLASGAIRGIDHGLTFHIEDKMRTVLWGWAGETLDPELATQVDSLWDSLHADTVSAASLRGHLTVREFDRLVQRVSILRETCCFPEPSEYEPSLPWPPM